MFEKLKFTYLKHSWFIDPLSVLLLLVAIPSSLVYGYNETKRVWNNLSYIDEYEENFGDKMDAINYRPNWEDLKIPTEKRDSARVAFDSTFYAITKYWPIAIEGDQVFTKDSSPGLFIMTWMDDTNTVGDTIIYKIFDDLVWDADSGKFEREWRMELEEFRHVGKLHSRMDSIQDGILYYDSIYTMNIVEWFKSDDLEVRFVPKSALDSSASN